jgi:hypothetical protein
MKFCTVSCKVVEGSVLVSPPQRSLVGMIDAVSDACYK